MENGRFFRKAGELFQGGTGVHSLPYAESFCLVINGEENIINVVDE